MGFDWRQFLLLCDSPHAMAGNAEARLRAGISRGYYGAFNLVRQFLEAEGHRFSTKAEVHQEVVRTLKISADMGRRSLGEQLGRLRQYRNQADYDDEMNNPAGVHGTVAETLQGLKKDHPEIFAPPLR